MKKSALDSVEEILAKYTENSKAYDYFTAIKYILLELDEVHMHNKELMAKIEKYQDDNIFLRQRIQTQGEILEVLTKRSLADIHRDRIDLIKKVS